MTYFVCKIVQSFTWIKDINISRHNYYKSLSFFLPGQIFFFLTLHLNSTGAVNALAGEVRSQWRGQLDESGSNLDGHTSPVHGAHAYADVLHAFGGDVGRGGLEGGPAVRVVSKVGIDRYKRVGKGGRKRT